MTDEIIEGEATDVTSSRAVAVVPPAAVQSSLIVGGTAGLALMSEEEFDRNLVALSTLRTRVDKVKKALMKEGVDYGIIPGTKKPALLKPGAETLLRTFGLADSYVLVRIVGDGIATPGYEIIAHARIHIGDTAGPIVAEGVGTANTFETKHRYRGGGARLCPNCGKTNVIHSKPPRTGWWCGTRDGGCSANFEEADPRITSQPEEKSENPDPWDLANTVTKMAKKRALVDGILTATGTSGIFTQDEDAPGHAPASAAPPGALWALRWTPGDTSEPGAEPDGPTGLQGVVEKAPDGIRHVKVIRFGGTEHAKLELVCKVNRSRHTAMLLDEAANRALGLELREGEIVRIIGGAVEEVIWQEGKPPKKELWGSTDVAVLREGAWILGSVNVPSLPLEDPPSRGSGTAAEPDPTMSDGNTDTTATRRRGPEGGDVIVKARLLEPVRFGTNRHGRYYADLRVVALDDTGEVIQAIVVDAPPGAVSEQLGGPDAPGFIVGSELVLMGHWRSGWLIASTVGASV